MYLSSLKTPVPGGGGEIGVSVIIVISGKEIKMIVLQEMLGVFLEELDTIQTV